MARPQEEKRNPGREAAPSDIPPWRLPWTQPLPPPRHANSIKKSIYPFDIAASTTIHTAFSNARERVGDDQAGGEIQEQENQEKEKDIAEGKETGWKGIRRKRRRRTRRNGRKKITKKMQEKVKNEEKYKEDKRKGRKTQE